MFNKRFLFIGQFCNCVRGPVYQVRRKKKTRTRQKLTASQNSKLITRRLHQRRALNALRKHRPFHWNRKLPAETVGVREERYRDIETHIYYSVTAADPVTYAQRGLSVKPRKQPAGNSLTLTAAETEPTGRSQLKEPLTVWPKGLRPSHCLELSLAIQSGIRRAESWLNALQIQEMSCATWLYHGQFQCTNTQGCQRWKAVHPRAGIWSGKTARTRRSSLLKAPSSHLHPPWSSTKMTNAWEVMEGITARTKSGEKQVWVWPSARPHTAELSTWPCLKKKNSITGEKTLCTVGYQRPPPGCLKSNYVHPRKLITWQRGHALLHEGEDFKMVSPIRYKLQIIWILWLELIHDLRDNKKLCGFWNRNLKLKSVSNSHFAAGAFESTSLFDTFPALLNGGTKEKKKDSYLSLHGQIQQVLLLVKNGQNSAGYHVTGKQLLCFCCLTSVC